MKKQTKLATWSGVITAFLVLSASTVSPAFTADGSVITDNSPSYQSEVSLGVTDINASALIIDKKIKLTGPQGAFSLDIIPDVAIEHHTEVIDSGITAQIKSVFHEESEGSLKLNLTLDTRANIKILSDKEGNESVIFISESGDFLGGIATAEATDATGAPIKVSYTVVDDTIQQLLFNDSGQITYPVNVTTYAGTVWYSGGWITTNPYYIVNINPTALGRQQNAINVHKYHVRHAKSSTRQLLRQKVLELGN